MMTTSGKINISCFATDKTSYGLVSLNLCSNIENCLIFPEGQITLGDFDLYGKIQQEFNPDDPSLRINHQYNMAPSIGNGKRFGMTFFEVDQFTSFEKNSLESLDHLIVSSEWAADICKKHLSAKPSICPLGVDRDIFTCYNYNPDKFVFLSVGKWEVRKNQDEIVNSFRKAFGNDKNVELWMMFDSPHISKTILDQKKKEYSQDNIKCFPRCKTQNDIARIMNMSSCFISHSKAEAWNMELLEAMSCGVQCISPCHSGESQYVNNKNCLITSTSHLENAQDGKYFGLGKVNTGQWHVPSNESLIENMKYAVKNYSKNTNGIETAKQFSWQNSAKSLMEILKNNA